MPIMCVLIQVTSRAKKALTAAGVTRHYSRRVQGKSLSSDRRSAHAPYGILSRAQAWSEQFVVSPGHLSLCQVFASQHITAEGCESSRYGICRGKRAKQ